MTAWKKVKFGDVVNFPPKCKLVKGEIYPYVALADLSTDLKYVFSTSEKVYTGNCSKFNNGDTLFARITPSLQNGKISQAQNLTKTGFGSGELFIFRGKDSVTNSDFIYYLSQTQSFKDNAIQSMVGASGRQRADNKFVAKTEIKLPPLPTQQKIAKILSNYDNLIENNLKRIKLLEESAKLTYEEWFLRFKINGKKLGINPSTNLPFRWKKIKLANLITKLESGSRPKGGIDKSLKEGVPSIGAESVLGIGKYNFNKEKLIPFSYYKNIKRGIIKQKDILIYKDGAYIGRVSMFQDSFPHKVCCVNEHVFLLNTGKSYLQNYLYFTLETEKYFQKMQQLNSNTAQPGINQPKLKSLEVMLPEELIIKKYDNIVENKVALINKLAIQNQLLKEARDILLPRLMTGIINTDNMNITI